MISLYDERLPGRFWRKVDPISGCWEWTASLSIGGYGKFGRGGKHGGWGYAHRIAYESLVGPVPVGLDLDHLCRNRKCVNPGHLEPVTRRENLLRGDTLVANLAKRTHCSKGHEYTKENTHFTAKQSRVCLECRRSYDRKRRPARPPVLLGPQRLPEVPPPIPPEQG